MHKDTPEPDWPQVAVRLKQALDCLKLSVREVSAIAGIGFRTTYKVLNVEKTSKGTAAMLATAMGINPEWLLYGNGPEPDYGALLSEWARQKNVVKEKQAEYRARPTYVHEPVKKNGLTFGQILDGLAEHLKEDPVHVFEILNEVREKVKEKQNKELK